MPRSSQSERPKRHEDLDDLSDETSYVKLESIESTEKRSARAKSSSTDDAPTIITPSTPSKANDPLLGLEMGSRLGNYEVIDAIGSGGMATVLKARDLNLGRVVALKILPHRMNLDRENVARFKLEARAAAQLDHDNIARVFTTGEDQGLHFIAFEFVEGETLRAIMNRRGILPAGECIRLMIQIAAGLTHASARGVVHRDIKPSNIIITPDGKAKIVDMGLARSLTVNGGVTQSGVTLGTFDYISPEQALDPRRTDVRSDIYSLGCTFYHALTGRPPVPDGTAAKKLYAHQHDPIADPRLFNTKLPDEIAAILAKMMAKDPSRRYADPTQLIQALTGVAQRLDISLNLEGMSGVEGQFSGDSKFSRVLPHPPRLPVGLLIGVAAFTVCVLILATLARPNRVDYDPVRFTEPPVPELQPITEVNMLPPPRLSVPTNQVVDPEVKSREELVRQLQNPEVTTIRLMAGTTYDLSQMSIPIKVAPRLNRLVIEGPVTESVEQQPILRIPTVVQLQGQASPTGGMLIANLKSLQLRRLRIEIAGSTALRPFTAPSVGIMLNDVNEFQLEDASIVPAQGLNDIQPIAISHRQGQEPGTDSISNCYFGLNVGTALQFAGPLAVTIHESGFGPQTAAIDLQRGSIPDPTDWKSKLNFDQCTFCLDPDQGSAIRAEPGLHWFIRSGYSIYATPPGMVVNPSLRTNPAVLLRVTANVSGIVPKTMTTYHDENESPNAYFNVRPYAEWNNTEERYRTFQFHEVYELQPGWTETPVDDSAAIDLKQSPWASHEPILTSQATEPWMGLRLNELFAPVRVTRDDLPSILGMHEKPVPIPLTQTVRPKIYDPWPLPKLNTLADTRIKVWYPDPPAAERDTLPRNVYEKLGAAVAALNPGDTLQLKFNDVRMIPEQITFPAVPNLNVTVEPFPGFKPILAPVAGKQLNPSLFQILDGTVRFENLNFLLEAKPTDKFQTMALIKVVAAQQCTLKNCVVTMVDSGAGKLAVVLLDDNSQAMTDVPDKPKIQFDMSVIRGEGHALLARMVQPFDLTVSDSLLALKGSVIVAEPTTRTTAGQRSSLTVQQSTLALGGPLFDLHTGVNLFAFPSRPDWVPVDIAVKESILSTWQSDSRIVTIDGLDSQRIAEMILWNGTGNWYANFPLMATFMEVVPAERMSRSLEYNSVEWFSFAKEDADEVLRTIRFSNWPRTLDDITAIQAKDVVVQSVSFGMGMRKPESTEVGVQPQNLPKPLPLPSRLER